MNLKELIESQLKFKECAILLSDGVDSKSLLFACLSLGIKVHAYSFTLEDKESADYLGAKYLCEKLGVPFTKIIIPKSKDILLNDLHFLIKKYKLKGKANVECSWIVYKAINEINEDVIISGHGCDGHFGLSKKAMIHFKHSIDLMDEFRKSLFSNENYAQKKFINEYCKNIGKIFVMPYMHESVIDYFKGKSWDELNKPAQKKPIIELYPEYFSKIKINKHSNFQLGDSGLSIMIKDFLLSDNDINKKGFKNPVGIYNEIYNKYHGEVI